MAADGACRHGALESQSLVFPAALTLAHVARVAAASLALTAGLLRRSFFLATLGVARRAFHPGPPGLRGSNNGRPSSRTQSPLALLGRLGIRIPFNLGPAGFLSRRHSCPDGSGSATLPWGIIGERGWNFTAVTSDRFDLALERLDLFFNRNNAVKLTCR